MGPFDDLDIGVRVRSGCQKTRSVHRYGEVGGGGWVRSKQWADTHLHIGLDKAMMSVWFHTCLLLF